MFNGSKRIRRQERKHCHSNTCEIFHEDAYEVRLALVERVMHA